MLRLACWGRQMARIIAAGGLVMAVVGPRPAQAQYSWTRDGIINQYGVWHNYHAVGGFLATMRPMDLEVHMIIGVTDGQGRHLVLNFTANESNTTFLRFEWDLYPYQAAPGETDAYISAYDPITGEYADNADVMGVPWYEPPFPEYIPPQPPPGQCPYDQDLVEIWDWETGQWKTVCR